MNMRRGLSLLLAVLAVGAAVLVVRARKSPERTRRPVRRGLAAADADRLAWWREARFGLFIHWGPVSLKGTEISWSRANSNPLCPTRGRSPSKSTTTCTIVRSGPLRRGPMGRRRQGRRDAVRRSDREALRRLLSLADGDDDYHIGQTPFRRDVCGELAECRPQGRAAHRLVLLAHGLARSGLPDRAQRGLCEADARPPRASSLTRFGRIDLLWFDWDGGPIPWDQEATYRLVREAQPAIVINNRLDCSFGGLSADRTSGPNADYLTPEQVIGAYNDERPWETCMTLGTQWSWKPDDKIKSEDEVIRILAGCAGGDGNLLLNVGPMPDGRIEPRQVDVLRGVGAWLGRCGESIYGTRGGPFKPGRYGASTRRDNRIYVHVFTWSRSVAQAAAAPGQGHRQPRPRRRPGVGPAVRGRPGDPRPGRGPSSRRHGRCPRARRTRGPDRHRSTSQRRP